MIIEIIELFRLFFLLFAYLPVEEIGCPNPRTRNNPSPLDFIEFFTKKSPRIIEIVGPLYEKGLSISDIAEQTGVTRYTIWSALKKHKKDLRSQNPVPFGRWRLGRGKMNASPPFGFCYFQGEVIKDPKEYPTLLLIQNLWKQGASISSIVRHLDGKGIQSRMVKPWSYNVIKAVIIRLESKQYEKLEDSRKTINDKKKSIEVKNES